MKREWAFIWTAWLLALMISFSALEGAALAGGGTTLSRYVWELSREWPLIPVIYGMIFGGLAVHFWWHWSPPGSESQG